MCNLHPTPQTLRHRTPDRCRVKVAHSIDPTGQDAIGSTDEVRSRRHGVYNRRLLSDQAPEVRTTMQTTTEDASNDVRASTAGTRLTNVLIWVMAIGGAMYFAFIGALAIYHEKLPPMWAHNTILAGLMIGALVCCTMVMRQLMVKHERERRADAHRLDREILSTYDVLARRLRDHGQQIAQTREAVASIRGQEHATAREAVATRLAVASCVAEIAAVREALSQVLAVVPEAEAAAFRRGLVAAVNPPADVVPINGRNGALNGYSGRS